MAQQIIALIAEFGVLLVFLNVLLTQLGAPLPAVPTLVVAGALAADGQLAAAGVLAVALVACLFGDLAWYAAGRRYGGSVMRLLCRISLSPDSCVQRSELQFQRWRAGVLLVAKFVPGLATVAPPLVGAMGLRLPVFLLFDGIGSLLWAGLAVALGYAFAAQIDDLLAAIADAGTIALELLGALLALYVLARWWQRRRLLRTLRMARITVDELYRAIEDGRAPVVVDVRPAGSRQLDTRVVPGALLVDDRGIDHALRGIPLDRELVVYCNCPNEVSAARVAKTLMAQGYRRVRPLLGGLEAWDAAGYGVDRLPAGAAATHGPDGHPA
ncbi:sulfurtransferase [Rhodanobacter sp. FW510-R12]|uniref:DedA family protein/thiosulfate sulfurtransferase GlpE n=1 Tax=unclassified Rhodanobacter TaxID=2621553 RepID=UPI0007AA4B8A|nr:MULTISPECIES: DedA family protein/thiosulfate sulfurtransferase GlpE [unclassified Rhodanobacter]KZC17653.1 sulfurtransferase [Rhodanobacter sp. FW104-R8]KZC25865.1 sulfurtransferase [Rhodanobacter sp. FW510-T8]KZC33256.1 sulfurtransferase [Rhodanobacter sp. FW510-R10]